MTDLTTFLIKYLFKTQTLNIMIMKTLYKTKIYRLDKVKNYVVNGAIIIDYV